MNLSSLLAGAVLASPLARRLGSLRAEPLAESRSQAALRLRQRAALTQSKHLVATSIANSDETNIPDWVACYSKGLPQNRFGEVEPGAYRALLAAMQSGKYADFERIPLGAGRKLVNPQAAFAFHLEGADPHCFAIPPAPSITSQEAAMETSELDITAHPTVGLPTVRADCTCAPLAFGMGRNISSLPPAARSAI